MEKAIVIQTAKSTQDRLTRKEDIFFEHRPIVNHNRTTIDFDSRMKFQQIIGFGGAFTEAGASVLYNVEKEKRARIIESYFHPEKGIAYSLCRTHINSCDFSLGNYSSDDIAEDKQLLNFTIERDKKYLIPFIKEALASKGACFNIIASPWSPPYWMKTNHQMNQGGKLRPDCRDAWALFFSKYIKAYQAEGIPIWGVTVQNEPAAVQPWDSCIYTAEEERDFIRDHLGPRLEKDGLLDKKIIIWDHNRDLVFEWAKTVLTDERAARYVWGVGFHWYVDDEFENVLRTHEAFPDKQLLLTEASIEGSVQLGAWDRGEKYGYNIIQDLNNWAGGWVDWNMVLNLQGGPNHIGNFCDAPVLVDEKEKREYYQNSYHYIGHFSKFVRPGAFRIQCRSSHDNLETTAFINPDRSVVIVVLNRSDSGFEFILRQNSHSAETGCPPHCIQTFIIRQEQAT